MRSSLADAWTDVIRFSSPADLGADPRRQQHEFTAVEPFQTAFKTLLGTIEGKGARWVLGSRYFAELPS